MLLTARHIKKIFADPYSLTKFSELRDIKADFNNVNIGNRRCRSCHMPNTTKHLIYDTLIGNNELLSYLKKFFNIKNIEMYFAKPGARKEIYKL